jgi:hypothetical protein
MVLATLQDTGGRALDMNGSLRLLDGPGGLYAGPYRAQPASAPVSQPANPRPAPAQRLILAYPRVSGRGVLAFISNHRVGPDMEIELFLLQPNPETSAATDL